MVSHKDKVMCYFYLVVVMVDITGLFLFYDITYCLELMNKMRWNKLASMTQESFVFIHSAVIVESILSSK